MAVGWCWTCEKGQFSENFKQKKFSATTERIVQISTSKNAAAISVNFLCILQTNDKLLMINDTTDDLVLP